MIPRSIVAQGRVRFQVVDPKTDRVHQDTGWLPNLMLNQGLDGLVTRFWADSFTNAAIGDSDLVPLKISGGTTTVSQDNVTVTLSGGSFVFTLGSADVGKVIKFSTGYEATIVDVVTPQTATVTPAGNVPGAFTFNFYDTRQTGLQSELVRSNDYVLTPGSCGHSVSAPSSVMMWRSFNFPIEGGETIYKEVGVSWDPTTGNNLFSRIILPIPVTVPASFRARVSYALALTLTPTSPTVLTAVMDGWPIAPATGTLATQSIEDWGVAVVNATGVTEPYRTESGIPILANEPSVTPDYLVGTDTQALGSPGDPVKDRWAADSFAEPCRPYGYSDGSFTVLRTGIVPMHEANSTNIRVFSVGHIIAPNANFLPVTTLLFDEAQTKTASFFIGLNFRLSWGRFILEPV